MTADEMFVQGVDWCLKKYGFHLLDDASFGEWFDQANEEEKEDVVTTLGWMRELIQRKALQ